MKVLILIFLAFSTAKAQSIPDIESRKASNSFSIGVSYFPNSLDPATAWHQTHFLILGCYLSNLVQINQQGSIVADFAKKWTISKDGKQYTFSLDPTKRFHDGSPVKSIDIATSLSRLFWPSSRSFIKEALKEIVVGGSSTKENEIVSGISMSDPSQITIKLVGPYAPFLHLIAMPGFGIVKLGPDNKIIGSGLMKVNVFTKDLLVLEANRASAEKTNSKVLWVSRIDEEAVATSLKSKQFDLVLGYADGENKSSELPPYFSQSGLKTLGILHIYFNLNKKLLANDRFRSALASLIRGSATELKKGGQFVEVQDTYLPKGLMPREYYSDTRPTLSPSEFKNTLKLNSTKNSPLQIYLRKEYFSTAATTQFQVMLDSAGIKCHVFRQSISELFERLRNGTYDLIMMGYFGLGPDPDGFLDPLNEQSNPRYGIFPSNKYFERLKAVRFLVPQAKRLAEYSKILRELEHRDFFVPMFKLNFPAISNRDIKLPDTSFRYDLDLKRLQWR